ncbi:protein FAM214A [Lates japonicus]|uniref:Protein FAM214A n=1 Tax=Lates japonicus TaxID=270547 RepID=A0AAD3NIP6_LATJO|nr:protein FAM214A [Lates japonicus]
MPPPLHKHECSDKLPQCRQARRTRSEVILLWRNSIPIMIEVMLLPDCCYGDECPPSDPISDPVIKQDALLLERWTLQPVPRQISAADEGVGVTPFSQPPSELCSRPNVSQSLPLPTPVRSPSPLPQVKAGNKLSRPLNSSPDPPPK